MRKMLKLAIFVFFSRVVSILIDGQIIGASLWFVEFIVNKICVTNCFTINNRFEIGIAVSAIICGYRSMFSCKSYKTTKTIEEAAVLFLGPAVTKIIVVLVLFGIIFVWKCA